MSGAHHDKLFVLFQRQHPQPSAVNACVKFSFDQPQIQLTRAQPSHDLGCDASLYNDRPLGRTLAKGLNPVGQQVDTDPWGRPHHDLASSQVVHIGHGVLGFGQQTQNLERIFVQNSSSLGQRDPAAPTLEERCPQVRFQILDMLADGRLGQQQTFSGCAEAASLDDDRKNFQLVEI